MFDALFAVATWKVAAAAFAVILVSTAAIALFSPKDALATALGDKYVSTDNPYSTEKRLWYDTGRVTEMLKAYGPEHYEAHQRFILLHDLIYPLCYGIAGVYLLAFLCPWRAGWARWLILLPLVMMAFDYAENFTMLAVLAHSREYRQTPLTLLEVSRAFTVAKQLVLLLSLAALILFLIAFVAARFRPRPPTPKAGAGESFT